MFFDDLMPEILARGTILSAAGLAWIILLVRIVGLRSFSKMTNFDFVMTVAMGSLLAGASQSSQWSEFLQTTLAMASLFAVQWGVAKARQASSTLESIVHNTPVLLMRDGLFYEDAMAESRVAKSDLIAKLREANVLELGEVRAVVLETTGSISVLHGNRMEEVLLTGVKGWNKDAADS